ncbi:MAG: transporter related [Rhodospirillales bacterium]|nr:transporter related [Rhodospirillales bacterium]
MSDEPSLIARNLRNAIVGPFDLHVAAGECLSIVGPSGAGKTLLLRMLADLDPSDGEVSWTGRARASWSGPAWRRLVGYLPAEPGWWTDRTGDHFEDLDRAAPVAEALGLAPGLFASDVVRLSTGERQRLALVRALSVDPRVLLLDEPTAALDAASVGRVETLLQQRMKDGLAIVLVTHDEALAARVGRAQLRISNGHPA